MNFLQPESQLTQCDREPIHHIAAVQDFGGLIALNADWAIVNRSVNCADLLHLDDLPEIGSRLADCFLPRAIDSLRLALERLYESGADKSERLFGLRLTTHGGLMDVALFLSDDRLVMEFEPHAEADYVDHLGVIGPVLSQLEPLRDLGELCTKTAALTRDLLGYDRAMVYKFHRDDSGEVIAEARRKDLEPYIGLRYPKADIPQQARELMLRNRMRMIADMAAEPVPIEPQFDLSGAPLDLSLSVLRSHSLMHVKYMANMGVKASLAIPIVRQGKLWGMISCHNYEPHHLPCSLRTVAEVFGQMFSLMLDRVLIDRNEQMRARGQLLHDRLMIELAGGTALVDSLPLLGQLLREAIPHDGMSVFIDGQYRAMGSAPDQAHFRRIAPALGAAPVSRIFATCEFSEQIPEAEAFADIAAGALILPISRSPRDYLMLWRGPLVQKVTWAGDPTKAIAPPGERLQPRGSFAAWEQTVEGRSEDWTSDEIQIAESLRVTLLEVVLRMTDEAARERARAQEKQELLIAELNHRVRNVLNLIRSLVAQSQDDAVSVASFAAIIGGRISALASAHDNITRQNWSPAPLSNLFETELAAYLNEKRDRFKITGDEVLIKPEAYTALALVIHELVTNSAKYGSLCDSTGELDVHFERTIFEDLKISWRERGGPPVKPPTRRGFGSTIIERSIPYELKGEAELRYKLTGVEADFLIPKSYLVSTSEHPSLTAAARPLDDAPVVPGNEHSMNMPEHVLVVEDSMIIALDTEENLKRLGVRLVTIASSVDTALASIAERRPSFAIVDFNLGVESSEPVTRELARLGVRFVLATGYAEMSDQQTEQLGALGMLRKPYGRTEIAELLAEHFPATGAQTPQAESGADAGVGAPAK
ncbi:MAG: HWE histidine kinase domain-containing protein [Pseudomonadota bacterium]